MAGPRRSARASRAKPSAPGAEDDNKSDVRTTTPERTAKRARVSSPDVKETPAASGPRLSEADAQRLVSAMEVYVARLTQRGTCVARP